MTDIVFAHDGTVAKIIGDALHVLFGRPGDQADHADRADRVLWRRMNSLRSSACAGIKTARASGERGSALTPGRQLSAISAVAVIFDYTAYGDTINVASRLEDANRQLGTRIWSARLSLPG